MANMVLQSTHVGFGSGAGFDSRALCEHEPGTDVWQFMRPLSYRTRAGAVFTIPSGMRSDGASIPRLVWSLLPSRDQCLEFGGMHDWLYRVGPSLGVASRGVADDIGWEILVVLGVGDEWQRAAIWDGLHLGGGDAWRFWRALDLRHDDPVALITVAP